MLGKLRRSNLSNFQISNIDKGMGAKIESVFGGKAGEGRGEGASRFSKKIQTRWGGDIV